MNNVNPFLLKHQPCKIHSMKIAQILTFITSITLLFCDEESVEAILLKTIHRMDSINHQFSIHLKETGKKEKLKNYQVSINWPEDEEILKQTRVKPIKEKKMKPSSFWEYRFTNGEKPKRWMSMPVTGKLKDMSHKKSSKKFTLADLEFTQKEITENEHSILSTEELGDFEVHIIQSVKKGKKGKVKNSKKLWINTNNYLIHKAEFYTKSGRLYRTVDCTNIQEIDGISFPSTIFVNDLKSKSEIHVQLENIIINPIFESGLFTPQNQ